MVLIIHVSMKNPEKSSKSTELDVKQPVHMKQMSRYSINYFLYYQVAV